MDINPAPPPSNAPPALRAPRSERWKRVRSTVPRVAPPGELDQQNGLLPGSPERYAPSVTQLHRAQSALIGRDEEVVSLVALLRGATMSGW